MLRGIFKRRKCNLCGWEGFRFMPMKAPRYVRRDAICPVCGTLERHRALIGYLGKSEKLKGIRLLDVAPVSGFKKYFESEGAVYFSTDLFMPATVKANMLAAPFKNGSFDIIICYHVLEHVREDCQVMRELKRILAPGGRLYLQVPMGDGLETTVEYGSADPYCHDHVREYGRDFEDRMKSAGLSFKRREFGEVFPPAEKVRYGVYNAVGVTYICS